MAETFVVYDAGALIAAQRKQRSFMALHGTFLRGGETVLVPVPVYAQVYRDDPSQDALRTVLRTTRLHSADRRIADLAARALGGTGTDDAVDAIVAATAVAYRAPVVTAAPDEPTLRRLLAALDSPKHPVLPIVPG